MKRKKDQSGEPPKESKYALKRKAGRAGAQYTGNVTAHDNWRGIPHHRREGEALRESPSAINNEHNRQVFPKG